ncbi:MAG: hypothetical protein M1115_09370 [Actinobacteria bacterium]|nr:hypothetical protein [Actinomycetota bacterium]
MRRFIPFMLVALVTVGAGVGMAIGAIQAPSHSGHAHPGNGYDPAGAGRSYPSSSGPGQSLSAPATSTVPNPLTEQGYVQLPQCPTARVLMTVSVNTLSLPAGTPLRVQATATNLGSSTCELAGYPYMAVQEIGPCGVIGMKVVNASGSDIWPGNIAINCPAEQSLPLVPGHEITAAGSWSQISWSSAKVTPGRYHLIVAKRFDFAFTVS